MIPSPVSTDPDSGGQRLLGDLYAMALCLVAQAQPGDVLYGATHDELLAAVRNVGAILPRVLWPFVVGDVIEV